VIADARLQPGDRVGDFAVTHAQPTRSPPAGEAHAPTSSRSPALGPRPPWPLPDLSS
jgi:hypothetical protein